MKKVADPLFKCELLKHAQLAARVTGESTHWHDGSTAGRIMMPLNCDTIMWTSHPALQSEARHR